MSKSSGCLVLLVLMLLGHRLPPLAAADPAVRLRFGVFVHEGIVERPAVYSDWVAKLPPRD